MLSPGAYAKATALGAAGLRALGPTADVAIYNYLQRSGGILGVGLEIGEINNPFSRLLQVEGLEATQGK